MPIQTTTLQTAKPTAATFAGKPITAWGGMSLLRIPEKPGKKVIIVLDFRKIGIV